MEEKSLKLGLIGYPLGHSFSKYYFEKKFENLSLSQFSYNLYPIEEIHEIKQLIKIENLLGFNVTIPHKKTIIPYLDQISSAAKEIGAVNTVKIQDELLFGENTDVIGFELALKDFLPIEFNGKALVLGSGGASAAAQWVLKKMDIEFKVVSRQSKEEFISYNSIPEYLSSHKLVINSTPVGMYPDINNCPSIPFSSISGEHYFYDMIYNPDKSLFLSRAENAGAKIMNGYSMFVKQAEHAWTFWTKGLKI